VQPAREQPIQWVRVRVRQPDSGASLTIGPDTDRQKIDVQPNPDAIAKLPADIKSKGTITIGIEANGGYPNSAQISGTQYGLTYDLARELANALGLKATIQAGPFPQLIPGLQGHRYDLSTSLYGESAERRQVLDFVHAAYSLGDVIVAAEQAPNKKLTFKDLCGLTVGTTAGSTQQGLVQEENTKCTAAGKPAINIKSFPSNPETVLAAVSNRVQAVALPLGGGSYAAKANPKLTLGPVDNTIKGYSGSALPKGSNLVPAVHAAMIALMNDGTWKKTLTIYGQQLTYPDLEVVEKNEPFQAASHSPSPAASS
jgi:polar amino acid transport system substrate-binding protein